MLRKVAGKAGRKPTWHRVSSFLRRRPVSEWERFTVRDGQKEPIEVVALAVRVQTRRHGRPKQETLLAMEALASRERWFFVSGRPVHPLHSGQAPVPPPPESHPAPRRICLVWRRHLPRAAGGEGGRTDGARSA